MPRYHWANVIDEESKKVRILSEQCKTCIFLPGDKMLLGSRRMHEVVQKNLESNSLLTCHATLPGMPDDENYQPAVCRGFWNLHGLKTAAGALAKSVIGIIFVNPPENGKKDDDAGAANSEVRRPAVERQSDEGSTGQGSLGH